MHVDSEFALAICLPTCIEFTLLFMIPSAVLAVLIAILTLLSRLSAETFCPDICNAFLMAPEHPAATVFRCKNPEGGQENPHLGQSDLQGHCPYLHKAKRTADTDPAAPNGLSVHRSFLMENLSIVYPHQLGKCTLVQIIILHNAFIPIR
jgi:hypothetical protein